MNRTYLPILLVLSSTGIELSAQDPKNGMLTPMGSAMILRKETTPPFPMQLAETRTPPRAKKVGVPGPVSTSYLEPDEDAPDYSLEALFGMAEAVVGPYVEIDAMSSGNDLLPLNPNNQLDGLTGRFAVLTFSLTKDSAVEPGSFYDAFQQSQTGLGAEVWSYYVDNSMPLSQDLWDTVRFEQGAGIFGLQSEPEEEAKFELSAFDLGMPVIARHEGEETEDPAIPNHRFFYFSVTNRSATWLNANPIIPKIDAIGQIDGATIMRMVWSEDANGIWSWSPITIEATRQSLGYTNGSLVDIDALMVWDTGNGPGTIVFSPVLDANDPETQEQLMLWTSGTSSPEPLMAAIGSGTSSVVESVVERIGVRGTGYVGDINAGCVYDPESLTSLFGAHVGHPTSSITPPLTGANMPEFELATAEDIIVLGDPTTPADRRLHAYASGLGSASGGQIQLSVQVGPYLVPFPMEVVAPGQTTYTWSNIPIPGFLLNAPLSFRTDFVSSDPAPVIHSSWVSNIIF